MPEQATKDPGTLVGDVPGLGLAEHGHQRIAWVDANLPAFAAIRSRFETERPLEGLTIAACLRVTAGTANLLRTLEVGEATVVACASNPLSTQTGVPASLEARVYDVRANIDQGIAKLKLEKIGVEIDELTDVQRKYLASWMTGT